MSENIKHEHDLGYKHILSHKHTFIEFLREFVKKDWVKLIKEEDLILIDKEFILEDFKEEEADIVYKVNIKGKDIIFYILLELQFVLYNGKNKWTAARNFKEILNGYDLFDENIIDFRYMLFDVNRMEEDELLDMANLISSVFLLDQDVEIEEIAKRLKLIGRIIRKNTTKEQQKVFKSWIVNIFKNRFNEEVSEHIQEVLKNTSGMEVDNMTSNLGKNIEKHFKAAREDGINKGIQQGIKQGIKQEKIETAKNLLNLGMDIDLVKQATKLSEKEIYDLKEEIDKDKN